jgi:hypothetical protein
VRAGGGLGNAHEASITLMAEATSMNVLLMRDILEFMGYLLLPRHPREGRLRGSYGVVDLKLS